MEIVTGREIEIEIEIEKETKRRVAYEGIFNSVLQVNY